MTRAGGGAVVNVSSAGGLKGYVGGTAYASAKAGVIMLSKVLAREHGKDRIGANYICPGSVHSEMFDGGLRQFETQMAGRPGALSAAQIEQTISKGIPMGRIGEPQDIASVALLLLRDDASFLNGTVIVVDGGQTL